MIVLKKDTKRIDLINQVCETLKKGGLVIVPSDTVYGLSVDATNSAAVEKLIAFKSRPAGKPISVFVSKFDDIDTYASVTDSQSQMLSGIVPGSYTVVLPSKHKLDSRLESERQTLGLRLINFDFISQLVAQFGNPITATSANISGASPHYSIDSLLNSLSQKKKDMIDLIVDFGPLPHNKPSTVIDLTGDELTVLRQGDSTVGVVEEHMSINESETKKVAQNLIKKWETSMQKKPLVIILKGDLGAGKTQFVKGIGDYFGVEKIISPTFVIQYEYKIPHQNYGYLYHVDLYNVTEKSEFKHLGFEEMLKPTNIICIEWGEKSEEIIGDLKNNSNILYVQLTYLDETKRKITVSNKQ